MTTRIGYTTGGTEVAVHQREGETVESFEERVAVAREHFEAQWARHWEDARAKDDRARARAEAILELLGA